MSFRKGWIPDDAPVIKLLDGANLDGPLEDRVYSSPADRSGA